MMWKLVIKSNNSGLVFLQFCLQVRDSWLVPWCCILSGLRMGHWGGCWGPFQGQEVLPVPLLWARPSICGGRVGLTSLLWAGWNVCTQDNEPWSDVSSCLPGPHVQNFLSDLIPASTV